MLTLRTLQPADREAFVDAVSEFLAVEPSWPFAFRFDLDDDFDEYVRMLEAWSKGEQLPESHVPSSYLVGLVERKIVGRVSLRHELSDALRRIGGHIGYGVVPSERGKGYATEMLRQTLPLARGLGISRAMLTCDDGNHASIRVIERCGGVLEARDQSPHGTTIRRYWISL